MQMNDSTITHFYDTEGLILFATSTVSCACNNDPIKSGCGRCMVLTVAAVIRDVMKALRQLAGER
jgi:hypothetical protein